MALDMTKVSDADLARMTTRAYREAARCWAEYRAFRASGPNGAAVKAMLMTSAEGAEAYWRDLVDEADRRLDQRSGIPLYPAMVQPDAGLTKAVSYRRSRASGGRK